MSFCFIILAGGNSRRFRSNIGKTYQKIANRSLIEINVLKALKFKQIKKIVVVYNKKDLKRVKHLKLKNIKLEALSVHIGSQILTDIPYKRVLTVLSKLIKNLDLNLKYIDLGGGFGINYSKKDKPINLKRYSNLVHSFSKKLNCKIIFEPGRSIVGNAGILVSKIQYIKNGTNKKFVIRIHL